MQLFINHTIVLLVSLTTIQNIYLEHQNNCTSIQNDRKEGLVKTKTTITRRTPWTRLDETLETTNSWSRGIFEERIALPTAFSLYHSVDCAESIKLQFCPPGVFEHMKHNIFSPTFSAFTLWSTSSTWETITLFLPDNMYAASKLTLNMSVKKDVNASIWFKRGKKKDVNQKRRGEHEKRPVTCLQSPGSSSLGCLSQACRPKP